MKVCTDGCVLGAWATVGAGGRLLDVGTGTGLLALMAAQRNPAARIDAVELDEAAAKQARQNVLVSPFAAQVRVWQGAIQMFMPPEMSFPPAPVYDHVLTNPPFFTNSLPSPYGAVTRALHTHELPHDELVTAVSRCLKPGGTWSVMLPPAEAAHLARLAHQAGMLPVRRLWLRHQLQKQPLRHLTTYLKTSGPVPQHTSQDLCIYEADGRTYSPAFCQLMTPFYLFF